MSNGWIGYDLDGTLADESTAEFPEIGQPVERIVRRLKRDLNNGYEVRVFTARVSHADAKVRSLHQRRIEEWCTKHLGLVLPVTCIKDFNMIRLYDDRAFHVVPNTGVVLEP